MMVSCYKCGKSGLEMTTRIRIDGYSYCEVCAQVAESEQKRPVPLKEDRYDD